MSEIFQQRITKVQLEDGIIPQNYVLVEMTHKSEGIKSKGGIIVGFLPEEEYEDETTSHAADLAEVYAIVYKLPERLYFKKDDPGSMPWDCDQELEIGDWAFFNVIESKNAVEILCEDKSYRLIPYADCYCAKRKRWLSKFDNKWTTDVIMLNGYVLLEQIFTIIEHPLAVENKKEDKTRGIVRYIGKPNREYVRPEYVDFKELEVGDEVMFNPGSPVFKLERLAALARFDNNNLYNVVQRRRIALVLSKNN